MSTVMMPTRLVFKESNEPTKEDFLGFIEWIQSAYGKGFPIHAMMKTMVDELYHQGNPSFFPEKISIRGKGIEENVHTDEGIYAYRVKFGARIGAEEVEFTLSDTEKNPSLEALVNMERIMVLALTLAVNGLHTPVEVVEEYMELTDYILWD